MGEILGVSKLRKEFGSLVAVHDVSLSLERGNVLGLIGPNGAGKTTLLRMIATLLPATSGSATVVGCDVRKEYLKARKKIGFMPDFFNLYSDLTIEECLAFFAEAYGVPADLIGVKIDETLEFVGLAEKRRDFIKHLSRGMVQRMGVAVLLVRDPDVYLLDEPASGLDPKARIRLRDILKKLSSMGKTIIISSHILSELSGFCSHIAIMDRGKVVKQGRVDEIQNEMSLTRKIQVKLLGEAEKAVELVGTCVKARVASVAGSVMSIDFSGNEAEMAELNALLVSHGFGVVGFVEEKMSLEDLFMKISA